MANRVSRSLLDPLFAPLVPALYRALPIPRRFPPEGIVVLGHLVAIVGAVGFALASRHWWAGLLAALGVAGAHLCDMVDGAHARATGQCRHGGELLDHFFDPLSFSLWMVGLGVAAGRLDLAIAGVLWIYATAVLTGIRAKITGEFILARIGPTEFKTLLVALAIALAITRSASGEAAADRIATGALWTLAALGWGQLALNLVRGVRAVNRSTTPIDTEPWRLESANRDSDAAG